jgi:hypothetical protein
MGLGQIILVQAAAVAAGPARLSEATCESGGLWHDTAPV